MPMSNLSRARGRRARLLVLGLALVIGGGCGGDGCAGCGLGPLPGGALPADQTVEGGAQVRVTPAGIAKVEGVVGDLVRDSLGDGLCIPRGSQGLGVGDLNFCFRNDGSCQPGCRADLNIDRVDLTPETRRLRIQAQFDTQVDVPVEFDPILLPPISCTLNVTANNTVADAIVAIGINADTGKLVVRLEDIPSLAIDPSISGCSIVGAVLDFVAGLVGGVVEDFVIGILEPELGALLEELLPDPLGIENTIDLSSFLGTISPGSQAALEARLVPGGYAFSENGGLSVGLIAGINADADPATRSAALDSEPARCVPAAPAPDLSGSLAPTRRGTFTLPAAAAFRGAGDAGSDVIVGLSETFLDLAGHHAIASGALCLGIGTQLIEQLTLGTIGIVAPSLAELGSEDGKDPLLLVTRPQQAIDFEIGEGSEESPSLTIHVRDLALDFYAFLFQRYTRGFTVTLDLDIGLNLEFATDDDGNPQITPVLVGLESEDIAVAVTNAEFLREDPALLEGLLPAVIDLAVPLLAGVIPEITLPEFLGFRLEGLALSKVTTPEDDFLAVSATLGAAPGLARRFPALASRERLAGPGVRRAVASGVRLVRVTTPPPAEVRARILGRGGAMPEVVVDVPARDEAGRALEWTWNLDGGLWRPFRPGGRLVLADGAFALQGRYDVQLKARVVGDYRTLSSEAAVVPVVIDSVGPRILGDRAAVAGGALVVPAVDLVSPAERVALAFGRPGGAPVTAWGDGHLPVARARELMDGSGRLAVWARDEVNNQTTALVAAGPLVGDAPVGERDEGGGCAAGGSGGGTAGLGALALLGLLALRAVRAAGARRVLARIGRGAAVLLLGGALAAQPACDCSGNAGSDDDDSPGDGAGDGDLSPGDTCEIDDDCADQCEAGRIPICQEDGACRCEDDVRWGRIGQYSEMAVAADGSAWVSAYNAVHGDLMVASWAEPGRIPDEAWEFVDGVPDGPVLAPGGVRGGVAAPGPDVGLYTDIAVASDGAVLVSYFDRDSASLKFASNRGGAWSSHVVAAGRQETEASFEIAGQYSAISVRPDGRPGIAFFAHVSDGKGERTELRFAEASSPDPAAAGDWTVSLIDSAAAPEPSADPLPIPMGVGLFVSAARLADGSPVVAYYDRIRGDLKLARYDAESAGFAAPEVLDGGSADVGWYPSVAVGPDDVVHVSYVGASNEGLLYVNTADRDVEVIDDGYREVGTTEGGVPVPELHFVGDDSALLAGADGLTVAYQDATSHELLVARRGADGVWERHVVAGDEAPFAGGYGFYVSAGAVDGGVLLSTWVVDQPNEDAWVEILRDAPPVD